MTPSRLRVAHLNHKHSVKHFPQTIRISQAPQTPSLAEEKLRLYEQAMAATGNGIVISDAKQPGLPIVYCNPAFEKITGYSKSEVLGKNCRFLQGNDTDPVAISQICQALHEGHECSVILKNYRKDGTAFWNQLTISPVRDTSGSITHFIGVLNDITKHKEAEEFLQKTNEELEKRVEERADALKQTNEKLRREISDREWIETARRQSEVRFRSIFEKAAIGISMMDMSGYIIISNPTLQKILGYSGRDLQNMKFTDFTHADDLAYNLELFHQLVAGERDYYQIEKRYYRKDGELVWAHVTISLVRDLTGKPKFCISMVEDITKRKQTEERLKASLKEKEVLLKEIHHRVKNNLQVISSLLKLQSTYIDDLETLGLFTDSQNRVKAMALIHEKLYQSSDLAHIHAGDYISNLAKNLFQSYSVNLALIELKIEVDDIYIDVDTAIPCGLIINELLCNSLKYAFPKERQGKIYIGFHLNKDQEFALKISDNGIGLPPDFNIEEIESLGLQLVCNLTEQLDGKLNVDSSQGTTFAITFATATQG